MAAQLSLLDQKRETVCEHCGAKVVEYRHVLSRGLVNGLLALYNNRGPAHLDRLPISKPEWTNFQKLRYWALVEKVKGQAGVWRITDKGKAFVEGREKARKWARTFRGLRVGYEGPEVAIGDVCGEFKYRKRGDYVSDAVSHGDFKGE